MTTDAAMTILTQFLHASVFVVAPILGVAAVVGVIVGIIQTATQINEPAIAYAAKVVGLVALVLLVGPAIGDKLLAYTRDSFASVAHVVE